MGGRERRKNVSKSSLQGKLTLCVFLVLYHTMHTYYRLT